MRRVSPKYDFPALEKSVLAFWKEQRVFEQSLEQRAGAPEFVFYEGPPTANGRPHPGHVFTRVIKDLFPRYKTMCGYRVERKGGWDTHGLPVEIEVEKSLGISGKDQLEKFGVLEFVRKCVDSVFTYVKDWEALTERIGFWLDMNAAYVTYSSDYVESVWWALKEMWQKGLLYEGYKVVPYCPRCGTALSSHEVGLGYKEVSDPSIYVRFRAVAADGQPEEYAGKPLYYLAWTTTPWTLLSNAALAAHPEFEYALVEHGAEVLLIARQLVSRVLADEPHRVLATTSGRQLERRRYQPLYEFAAVPAGTAHFVILGNFVTLDTGTGIVHTAPAFGQEDYEATRPYEIPVIQLVNEAGRLTDAVTPWAGMFVKNADTRILQDLEARGLVLRRETYRHDYPHCWRCETPLIYYARRSWFIRTTAVRERLLALNDTIGWFPEHIRTGRFGNFLKDNVDWALSRERYWGTPLPIWRCEHCGFHEAISSRQELAERNAAAFDAFAAAQRADPSLPDMMALHKPFIDGVAYECGKCGGRMRRVPEVIDCWFDSGAMPFAQWGYHPDYEPPLGKARFEAAFPCDFIAEAIDQTRGWFYSLLAISTILFNKPAYKNCIVLGLVCDEKGQKMSKSKGNYVEPATILDRDGADALRWYFYLNSPPASPVRFSEAAVRDAQKEFLLKIWNVYSFFTIYAAIDGFDPRSSPCLPRRARLPVPGMARQTGRRQAEAGCRLETGDWRLKNEGSSLQPPASGLKYGGRQLAVCSDGEGLTGVSPDDFRGRAGWQPHGERPLLDRWITGELALTIRSVRSALDAFDYVGAAKALWAFVDALSNWYVRRSRDRFWKPQKDADKWAAYWTLYETLLALARLLAPFAPFVAEEIYRNLAAERSPSLPASVHLTDYPAAEEFAVDLALSQQMSLARRIVSLGRAARAAHKIKVRQPLASAIVILADATPLPDETTELIKDELNVKAVAFETEAAKYVTYSVKPNYRLIGPRFGKHTAVLAAAVAAADAAELKRQLDAAGAVTLAVPGLPLPPGEGCGEGKATLASDELLVSLEVHGRYAAAGDRDAVVVLDAAITPELRSEGIARELVSRIQNMRKELDLPYEARIHTFTDGPPEIAAVVEAHRAYIARETLSTTVEATGYGTGGGLSRDVEIDGIDGIVTITVIHQT